MICPFSGALSHLHPRFSKKVRESRIQGKFQIYGLLLSLAMALVGGIMVGK